MTTRRKRRAKGWAVRLGSAAIAASLLGSGSTRALAGSAYQPDAAGPDSAYASLRVETLPPGLIVLVDGVKAGRAPVGPLWLPARDVRVQALPADPARFEPARDAALVALVPGSDTTVVLDLRPSVLLRTEPEPALVFVAGPARRGEEVPAGESPIRLAPARLAGNRVRLEAPLHADTTLSGDELIAKAALLGGSARIALRRVAPVGDPPPARRPPLLRRRWVHLTLIGVGAALTGGAALLRREGDRWYARYQSSSDPDLIPGYYDKTIRYDRLAAASLGAGQVAITAGLFLLVTGSDR